MAHTSLQVCIDSSDWLQGTMSEEMSTGIEHSSSSRSGGTITDECMLAAACSSRAGPAALMERRLRPAHDQNLKCPRCDSNHTKFCYYNNYSLSQPRYFCKTCRRYWTKGGTLRNIPVGGGCRKNKKSSSKKSTTDHHHHHLNQHQSVLSQGGGGGGGGGLVSNPTDLHLSFPEVQFPPHLANLIGAQMSLNGGNFMENGLNILRPIDFMESKYEGLVGGNSRGHHDFMATNANGVHEFGVIGGNGDNNGGYNGILSPNGFSGVNISPFGHHDHIGNNSGISFMDQRLLLPFDGNNNENHQQNGVDVKPNPKLLSLEWQDQGCNSDAGKDAPFGYNVNGSLNSWSGMMPGFQPSTTDSLV